MAGTKAGHDEGICSRQPSRCYHIAASMTGVSGMAQKEVVREEKDIGVTTVWMNRPEKKNAMNPALHEAMDRVLMQLETDPDTKVVVIRGAGGNFSAGQDLKEFFRDNEDNPAAFKRAAEHANR